MNFYGYKRPDGRVGVRNKVLILPASVCASDTTRIISQQVVALNSEMTTLQSEEAKLRAQYELAYDLDAIQESLTTSGTMVEPQNGQTVYVDLSEPNTVKVFQQEEGTSGLEGMFQSVKSIAEEIVTYFR